MSSKIAVYFLIFISILLLSCEKSNKKEDVTISGRELLVNKIPYVIKGICYHPVPKGSDKRSFDYLTEDLALMVEAGINTIRVYEPIDDKSKFGKISYILILNQANNQFLNINSHPYLQIGIVLTNFNAEFGTLIIVLTKE